MTTFHGFIGPVIFLSEKLDDKALNYVFMLKGKYDNFLLFSELNKVNYFKNYSEEMSIPDYERAEKFFIKDNKEKAEKKKEKYQETLDLIISPISFQFVKEENELSHSEPKYYSNEHVEKKENFLDTKQTTKIINKKRKIQISRIFNKDFHLFVFKKNIMECQIRFIRVILRMFFFPTLDFPFQRIESACQNGIIPKEGSVWRFLPVIVPTDRVYN